MLILSRRIGEAITIDADGHPITVTVLKIHPRRGAQLGIAAERGVTVHREEVAKRIEAEVTPA